MSGIAGIVHRDGRPVRPEQVEQMLVPVPYRGADGRGISCNGPVGLGHLQLISTPESKFEEQPLHDEDGALRLVADVRLDNREELIGALSLPKRAATGTPWTDPGLILEAWRKWGTATPAHLLGDYAFILWDASLRRLFAARDPMGLRSLYFRIEPDRFLIASEITQITAVTGVPRNLFEPALAARLCGSFGLPDWTAFEGIARLPAGEALLLDSDGLHRWRFWDPDPDSRIRYRRSEEYVDHFRNIFRDSVRSRLRTTRPVGLLLSGGVDSVSIAATAGSLLAREAGVAVPEFRAYSFAWDELDECDERHISHPIARHLGIPVTEIPADDAWPLRGDPLESSDPNDPFLFGHYALLERSLRRAGEEGAGLILSGDRGDLVTGMNLYDLPEYFWGGRWRTLARHLKSLASWNNRTFAGQLRRELVRIADSSPSLVRPPWSMFPRIRRLRAHHLRPPPDWVTDRVRRMMAARSEPWFGEIQPRGWGYARRERLRHIFSPLHMRGIAASERLHALHGSNFADPWSDRRLAEFALAVPQNVLTGVGEPKRLPRLALRRDLPVELAESTKKIIPSALYHRGVRDRATQVILDLFEGAELTRRGYLREDSLVEAYRGYRRGVPVRSDLLWNATTSELWLRAHWRG